MTSTGSERGALARPAAASDRRFRTVGVVLSLLAAVGPTRGDVRFTRTGTEAGIPGDVVSTVQRGSDGFLWLGTRNGLARYDGYSCVVYDHDPADPTSLSDNWVRLIYEDRQGRLWIGTNAGGLNRFDRETGRFQRYRHDPTDPRSLSHDSVYALEESAGGSLWVGTQIGLNRFHPATESFERMLHDPFDPDSPSHDYVLDLHEMSDGRLLVATFGGGLNVRDPETGRFHALGHDPADSRSLDDDRVIQVVEDPTGRLWVGTYSGVNVMDHWGSFRRELGSGADPSLLSGDIVTSMDATRERLWVGFLKGGLLEIDLETEEVHRRDARAGWGGGGAQPLVVGLDVDDTGIVWVATWGEGVLQARPDEAWFGKVAVGGLPEDQVSEPDVLALLQDSRGRLWAGAMDLGLLSRDVDDESLERVSAIVSGVQSLAEGPDGAIWAGTTDALHRYEPESGRHDVLAHARDDPTSLPYGYVTALLWTRAGALWVGTGGGGLARLRSDAATFDVFRNDPDDVSTLSDDYVTQLHEDGSGRLWVGTRSGGLNAIDPKTGRGRRFTPDGGRGSFSHHGVTAIHEDGRGRLWIGTAGGGVNRTSTASTELPALRFEVLDEADGLPDDNVMGIAADTDGSTWISTKRGIARWAPDDDRVVRFGLQSGLPMLEMNGQAYLGTPHGIYFGSPRGIVWVPTGTSMPMPTPSPIALTAARRQGDDARAAALPPSPEGIELDYREWFSIEFAVLDLSPERNHRHEYRLGGDGAPWVELGGRRELTFLDLAPGTHWLEVRGRNSQGAWTQLDAPVAITVIPPFWMTTWFRGLLVVAAALAVVAAHQARTRALRHRNAELVRLERERAHALAEAKRSEGRLRALARRLEVAKEEERKHLARELHDELGQSLTAVKVNLELAKRDAGAESNERVDDSTQIVDQLIHNIRSLSLNLRPPLMEEQGLVPALRAWLAEQSRRADIDISMRDDPPPARMHHDIETAAFRSVQEAVTNALRHAGASMVRVGVSRDGDWLRLVVEDDGRGFDSAAMLERAADGRHVGILGLHERVQSLGGEIRFESAPGEGTTVRVSLPWEAAA